MIVNEETKTIFLENPKTGSSAFRDPYRLLAKSKYAMMYTHGGIVDIPKLFKEVYPDLNPADFTVYTFYRDPTERLLSGWRFALSQIESSRVANHPDFNLYDVMAAKYLSPEDVAARKPISFGIERYMTMVFSGYRFPTCDLACRQIRFMDNDTVLLDFRKFNSEAVKLFNLLGMGDKYPTEQHVRVVNATDSKQYAELITPQRRKLIESYYQQDYEFLAKRGITF